MTELEKLVETYLRLKTRLNKEERIASLMLTDISAQMTKQNLTEVSGSHGQVYSYRGMIFIQLFTRDNTNGTRPMPQL